MHKPHRRIVCPPRLVACLLACLALLPPAAQANETRVQADTATAVPASPWGRADLTAVEYGPQKVVFDVDDGSIEWLEGVLDRASYMSVLTGADPFESSIVLVIHGDAIPRFAIKHFSKNQAVMRRAQSLTVGDTVSIRICAAAARQRGFEASDFHGFVELVPMADAEIVRLQREENHAYMR